MNKGLVSIAEQLDKVAITPPSPIPIDKPTTPKPIKSKVVSNPVRQPINRQAARIIAKPPWWAKLDAALDKPSGPPPTLSWDELKAARRENAELAKEIGKLRERNRVLQKVGCDMLTHTEALEKENAQLKSWISEHERNIKAMLSPLT